MTPDEKAAVLAEERERQALRASLDRKPDAWQIRKLERDVRQLWWYIVLIELALLYLVLRAPRTAEEADDDGTD